MEFVDFDLEEFKQLFTEDWKLLYGKLLEEEHLESLWSHLLEVSNTQFRISKAPPFFELEVNVNTEFHQFQKSVHNKKEDSPQFMTDWANAIKSTSIEDLLLLLGQRITPASIRDERAIPPTQMEIIQCCFQAYNTEVSKAVRAFEKHSGRYENDFWGSIKGTPEVKELQVKEKLIYILKNRTWWNVFYHYQHAELYEVRVNSGHGFRLKLEPMQFIGFVEPFLKENYS